jgi:hypothetical protein
MQTVEDIREELLIAGTHAAATYLRDGFLTVTGVPKTKTRNVKAQENAEVEAWAKALWLAYDRSHTPHHWRMVLIDRAKDRKG